MLTELVQAAREWLNPVPPCLKRRHISVILLHQLEELRASVDANFAHRSATRQPD